MSDEPREVQPIDPERRIDRRVAALALIGVAGAVVAAPKEAKADLVYSDIVGAVSDAIQNTIQAPIRGTFQQSIRIGDLLSTAFKLLAGLGIPPEYMQLLRCVLGSGSGMSFSFDACSALREVIGGEGSMTRTERIQPTMEELWHREAQRTDVGMDEKTIDAFETYFRQVQESQAITATAAEGQDTLGMLDTENLMKLDAAAAGGHVIEVMARIGHLVYGGNQRLALIIQSLNASQQTRGAQLLVAQHQRYLEATDRERERAKTMVPVAGANPTVSGDE